MKFDLSKYERAFVATFGAGVSDPSTLEYQSIPEWDSVGHMALVATLEEEFEIMLEMDDILDFSSFAVGVEILSKYLK